MGKDTRQKRAKRRQQKRESKRRRRKDPQVKARERLYDQMRRSHLALQKQIKDQRRVIEEQERIIEEQRITIEKLRAHIAEIDETAESEQQAISESQVTEDTIPNTLSISTQVDINELEEPCIDELTPFVLSLIQDCKKHLGVPREVFDDLLNLSSPYFRYFRASGSPMRDMPREQCELQPPIDNKMKLVLVKTLFWLRQYPTQDFGGLLFGDHPRTFARQVRLGINVLFESLQDVIKWPSDNEIKAFKETWNKKLPTELQDVICAVDGSEWRISRPTKCETDYYSPKKKQHSLNVIVVSLLNGRIIYISPYLFHGAHDQRDWNALKLREHFIGKDYGIVGDGGFTFNRLFDDEHINGHKPHRRSPTPKGKEPVPLTDEEKEANRKLSQFRVVIENVFYNMKIFRVFGGRYRHYYGKQNKLNSRYEPTKVIHVVAAITELKLRRNHYLRKDDWLPTDDISVVDGDSESEEERDDEDE